MAHEPTHWADTNPPITGWAAPILLVHRTPALASVLAERERQDAKWGEQNNDPFCYLTVLMEEVGELAQAALHTRFGGSAAVNLREEAVHTAAVALAIVECLDRGLWRWPGEEPP